ncbi:MAG TPA: DUF2807 domain-containing protein [Sphingomonas sp.]|jgi:hypothetical protein|nr:DUF2807 domain-containing protein [Sphingomonas sp.]
MIMRILMLAALALPAPALAADRVVGVGSFSRVRIEGGFEVRIVAGSPRARISGERDAIEAIDLHVDGTTLVVRRATNGTWSERPVAADRAPIVIALATPALENSLVVGGSRVEIARMAGRRVGVTVTGTGAVTVASTRADLLVAQVIGSGSIALAGTATNARLSINGPGTIDAATLDAGDVVVRNDGLGTTNARARYTATVDNVGLGSVTIAGNAKCTVRAAAGGPVACGRTLR